MAASPDNGSDEGDDGLKSRRRAQLLDAALDLFSRRDFHEVTIDEIARAASVAKGTIYWYFDSKEALLVALVEREFSRVIGRLTEEIASAGAPIDKLSRLVNVRLWLEQMGDRFGMLMAAVWARSPGETRRHVLERIAGHQRRLFEMTAGMIREVIGPGAFQGLTAEDLAVALAGWMRGLIIQSQVAPGAADPDRMTDVVRRVFLRTISGGAGAATPEETTP